MIPPIANVVIVNYGSSHLLPPLLESIDAPHRLIIVDNFSSPQELRRLEQTLPTQALLVKQENLGFAGGVNAGWRAADPALPMVVINPDARLHPGSLKKLVSTASELSIDIASPRILHAHNGRIWFDGGSVNRWTGEVRHHNYGASPSPDHSTVASSFISGCVMYLSVAAQGLLLPMNEDLFMYYEDAEISTNARRLSLNLGVVRSAIAVHDEGSTSKHSNNLRSPLFYYYQSRNRLLAELDAPRLFRLLTTPLATGRLAVRIMRSERPARPMLVAVARGVTAAFRGRSKR